MCKVFYWREKHTTSQMNVGRRDKNRSSLLPCWFACFVAQRERGGGREEQEEQEQGQGQGQEALDMGKDKNKKRKKRERRKRKMKTPFRHMHYEERKKEERKKERRKRNWRPQKWRPWSGSRQDKALFKKQREWPSLDKCFRQKSVS